MDKYELAIRQDRISAGKNSAKDLAVIIGGVYAQAGQAILPNELASMAKAVFRDIQSRFSALTIEEIRIALDNGIRGDYGAFYGLNVITFNNWLKAYKQSDERYKAIKNIEMKKNALPPPGAAYNEQKMQEMCLRYFEDYKKVGDPGIACVTVYQHLQKIGVINQSKEYKISVLSSLRGTVKKSNNLAVPNEIIENRLKCEAMKICLKRFFQELIDNKTELKDKFK